MQAKRKITKRYSNYDKVRDMLDDADAPRALLPSTT